MEGCINYYFDDWFDDFNELVPDEYFYEHIWLMNNFFLW